MSYDEKFPIDSFQDLILALQTFWKERGCLILQPLGLEIGSAAFHPETFLRAFGPEPWNAAYVQPSRLPAGCQYGDSPIRPQYFHQFQVILKPSPENIQDLYLDSLCHIGIDHSLYNMSFTRRNWEETTLVASGLYWKARLNGIEISQFTYFQQMGGYPCNPVMGELTYGLERIASHLFKVKSIFDIPMATGYDDDKVLLTYGDVYHQNEVEMSYYNFNYAPVGDLLSRFNMLESECKLLLEKNLPLPAYERVIQASHLFNLLDARHALSVTERQRYIFRLRDLSKAVAEIYLSAREHLGFPLLQKAPDRRWIQRVSNP